MRAAVLRSLSVIALVAVLAAPASAQDLFRGFFGPRYAPPPQQQQPPAPQKGAPGPQRAAIEKKIEEVPPAYEGEMSRLAEILGALHYLRPLCGTAEGDRWRNEMQALIDIEQAPQERRDRLVASFNRSYVAYEQTYRNCTPAAGLAVRRFLDEGAKLSREIATKYGN